MIIAEVTLPVDENSEPGWLVDASNERAIRENLRLDGDPDGVGTARELFDTMVRQPGKNRWLWLVALPDDAHVGPLGELGLPTVSMAKDDSLPPSTLLGEMLGIERAASSMMSVHYVDVVGDHELLREFLSLLDRLCLERGIRDIGLYSLHRGVAGDEIPDDVLSQGLRDAGFASQVVEWESRLMLPVAPDILETLAAPAREKADGYVIDSFTGTIPQHYLADFAELFVQMRTAAPSGDMPVVTTPLTAKELGERDPELFLDGGQRITTFALHEASGRVVSFSEVWLHERALAFQGDLLVDADHRGHRLATLMKLAAFERLAAEFPHVQRLQTVNAIENTYIRSLNTSLGFRPVRTVVGWSKKPGKSPR